MSKKITRLEKETLSWKQKWENTHKALLSLAAEKQGKDAEVALQTRQLAQLQKLCRTMQTERSSLLAQLKASGVSPILKGITVCGLNHTSYNDNQISSKTRCPTHKTVAALDTVMFLKSKIILKFNYLSPIMIHVQNCT